MRIQDLQEFKNPHHPLLVMPIDTPVEEAVRQMSQSDYSAIAATVDDKYAGLFTEAHLLEKGISRDWHLRGLTLRDVATNEAPVAHLDDDAYERLGQLSASHARHMPVVDGENHVVGILSERDFTTFTWTQAMARAAESTRANMGGAYQPFFIVTAVFLYTLLVVYLIGTVIHLTGVSG